MELKDEECVCVSVHVYGSGEESNEEASSWKISD